MTVLSILFATFTITYSQYAAPLLGDVGLTSVSGLEDDGDFGKQTLPVGTHIYGPFEAGFTSMQDFVLAKLGCQTGKGYISGGVDTWTAEAVVAKDCGVELPRWEGNNYISLLGTCGGHTGDYHFHERLSCLYEQTGTHSTRVGDAMDGKGIYGKWENFQSQQLPMLDACGGHWGPTPDGDESYHYHVQDTAPFTVGCFGPNPDNSLVTVEQCRSLYSGCGDGDIIQLDTKYGVVQYDPWCPCYDADGSTIGTKSLKVFDYPDIAQGPGGPSVLQKPSFAGTAIFGGKMGGGNKKKGRKMGGKMGRKFRGKFGESNMKGRKMGGKTSKFRQKFTSKFNSNPFGAAQTSFRVVQTLPAGSSNEQSNEQPSAVFQIVSQKYRKQCLDATSKKITMAKCNTNKITQKFVVVGGNLLINDQCISNTLVLGPCNSNSLTAAAAGTTGNSRNLHTLIAVDKCTKVVKRANGKHTLKVANCNGKANNQKFEFNSFV